MGMLSDKWRQSQLEAMGVPLHLSGKFVELEITDSDLERLGFAPSVGDRTNSDQLTTEVMMKAGSKVWYKTEIGAILAKVVMPMTMPGKFLIQAGTGFPSIIADRSSLAPYLVKKTKKVAKKKVAKKKTKPAKKAKRGKR